MNYFTDSSKKLKHIWARLASFHALLLSLLQTFLFKANPFWIELAYFFTISSFGFFALKATKPRTFPSFTPKDMDIFFTSVSATTVSSMSTLEMEVFSSTQLVFLTIMMFFGGEVFTSILGLQLMRAKTKYRGTVLVTQKVDSRSTESDSASNHSHNDHIELGILEKVSDSEENLRLKSIKTLALCISCYLLVTHTAGSIAIAMYLGLIPSAREVLKRKGLNMQIFPIFTTVSTFANCGFVPTSENMVVFKKNSGILLILIPQTLMGNTLYPVCLRGLIWFVEKVTKREELRYLLKNPRQLGYGHLFSGLQCVHLAITGFGLIVVQLVMFCVLEWNSEANAGGLSGYQKLVGSLFQVVNSRHSGESVFDLSVVSPAMLVLFVLMMYLPPYTSYVPIDEKADNESISTSRQGKSTRKEKGLGEIILFSQLTYLCIFIILICITERHMMKRNPLNFNVLNIVVEVISAYGNVGFSVGYSCRRKMKPDGHCKDALSGFAGRWSNEGKIVLILVMLFGKLKKYGKRGGRAWGVLG